MTEYVPTTKDVREAYATRNAPVQDDARRAQFDRWLDRVKAEALREAADEVDRLDFGDDTIGSAGNWGAKTAADLLRNRADRIERGEVDE